MKPSDFYTVPRSEAGLRVPLVLPDGKESGEWLLVIGPDSRAYARAHQDMLRRYAELGGVTGDGREAEAEAILLDYRAALVIAWSFDEPCTPAAVREFLANAPRVGNQVEALARNPGNFSGPGSSSSTSGQRSSANSEAGAGSDSVNDSGSRRQRRRRNSSTSSASGATSAPAA